jgi:hypothetical protein
MDCEKFEAAMMDELYGELDELTSAAMKRHSSGCPRCASLLEGLRATRKLVAGSTVDVPPGLEARVLDAANEAQKVVPIRRRFALAVSVAGSWAMRPQSAMAAVFMVMLGTSLLLLRGRSSRAPASAEVTVTQHGTPAPAAQAGPDPAASAVATQFARPAEPKAAASALAAQAPGGPVGGPPAAEGLPQDDMRAAKTAARSAAPARDDEGANAWASNAPAVAAGGFAAPPPAAAPAPVAMGGGGGGGGGGGADIAYNRKAEQAPSAFDTALRLYQSGRYDEAARAFDALSAQDPNADLYAARSAREDGGCTRGVAGRFDRVAQRAKGTPTGWDALLEGALCYRSLGDFAAARARLTPLLTVDSHKDRARIELDRLGADQPRAAAAPAAKAQPAARPAGAAAPASPPANVGGQ